MGKISKFFDKFKHEKDDNRKPENQYVEDMYVDQEFSTGDSLDRTMNQEKTTTVKKFSPDSYNDLQQAADALNAYKHVVISFENMNDQDYKRSLNFMSGFVYALNGSINKIEPKLIEFIIRK